MTQWSWNERGSILTSVVDLMFLLIIAFLAVGVFVRSLEPPTPGQPGKTQVSGTKPASPGPPPSPEQTQKVQDMLAMDQQKAEAMAQQVASLTAEISHLKEQLAAVGQREKELKDLAAELAGRNTGLHQLEQEKAEYTRKLAEVQAALATAGKDTYTFASGAPLVNRSRTAQKSSDVMLSEGKVIPIATPYYTGKRQADNSLLAWPVQAGLSIQDALQPDSPLMKEINTAEFRKEGRVRLFVNADSFATFRALRDALVRDGIDYGWEPVEGPRLRFGTNGADVPSQTP